jgi:hypothetical protein
MTMWRKIGRWLAIGYVALALLPLVGFAFVFTAREIIPWMTGSDYYWPGASPVTSPERAKELAKKGLMEQLVTFRDELVGLRKDPTTKQFDLYAIPVGQTTLPQPVTPTGMFNLVGREPTPGSAQGPVQYESSRPITGQFNNVILLDTKTGEYTKVFNERVGLLSFKYVVGPAYEALLAFATGTDSNKDGELSGMDMLDLYVYSLKDGSLRKVSGLNGSAIQVSQVEGQAYIIVRAVQDINDDGMADDSGYARSYLPEPARLYRLDLATAVATPLLPEEMVRDLQKTLNASEPAKR